MSNVAVSVPKAVLEFKSTSLTVPVLILTGSDGKTIEQQIKDKVAQAPEFFKHSPLLVDLQKLNAQHADLAIDVLIASIRQQGFMPIGIRGGTDSQNQVALSLGLPVHALHGGNVPLNSKPEAKVLSMPEIEDPASSVDDSSASDSPQNNGIENKLIDHPVRSGQRVYARGDLIVTASVSVGAEIMAEGNIHVYGTLRGRALAGVLGNTAARIFCSDLQAELISIAGIYQLSDDLGSHAPHKPVQISLDKQTLLIKDI
ncbi:MAG: septum site-determining protein MinC [Methylomonas sp.]|nr:septum site-determining protein MinC [Methylomonas sp.]PPD21530.1 MAG: septum site-determining protein MinC [Methylomonas sp.]PPD26297.1 MAG: septum site-determining protein MinC [Methylomonas sp.]PPD38014.1 MAG: septum site-determining protein MinC [Methylomonas sp.]PPD38435.1 MAG: septum site-determining protein MinC [Methylomonas sp.]